MTRGNSSQASSQSSESAQVDDAVLNGDACVKCGFKCIEGCV